MTSTNWQRFASLGTQYRESQISLLRTGLPESMSVKELAMWGKLCAKALQTAHKSEINEQLADHIRQHWSEVRSHAVLQLQRTMTAVEHWQTEAEEVSVWETCAVFDLMEVCARVFQEESDVIQLALSKTASLSQVPASVSVDTLKRLASLDTDCH